MKPFASLAVLSAAGMVLVCAGPAVAAHATSAPAQAWTKCGPNNVAKDGPGAEVKRVKNTTCKAAKRAARKGDYTQYPYGWAIPRWSCKVVGHYSEGSYTKCSHRGKKLVVRAGA